MPRNPDLKADGRIPPRAGTWWSPWAGAAPPNHGQRRPVGPEADRVLQFIMRRAAAAYVGTSAAVLADEMASTVQRSARILRHLEQCGLVISDQPTRSMFLPTQYVGLTEQIATVEQLVVDLASVDARTPRAGLTALIATARRVLCDAGPSRGYVPYTGARNVPVPRPVPLTDGRRHHPATPATTEAAREASKLLNSIRWGGRRRECGSNGSAHENAR